MLAALAAVMAGLGLWVSDIKNGPPQKETDQTITNSAGITPPNAVADWNWRKPVPGYVRVSVSYVAAYCIGWLFRRVLRLIVVAGALAITLLGVGKFAGWDMTHTQEQVKRSGEWAQRETTTTKDHLKSLLPSASAAGIGMFLGFRRRHKTGNFEPAT